MRLVLASANPDKSAEIRSIIEALVPGVELVPRPAELAEVIEDGATLEENARLKAAAVAGATGLPALADDTGLEVDGLGGAPGVFSARYAGEGASYAENVAKLLRELGGAVGSARRATFRTVAIICWPDGREIVADGSIEGHIAPEPHGARGFGYDPVFVPDGGAKTYAELSEGEKNAISHRSRALHALAEKLAGALRAGATSR